MAIRGPDGKFVKDGETGEQGDMAPQTGPDVIEDIPPGEEGTRPETVAPGKRGPGRPPGSGKKGDGPKRRATGKADAAALSRQIQGAHLLAATFLGIPELIINEAEARLLADGMAAMADEFGLSLGGKAGAVMLLVSNMGLVYGPRVFAIAARMAAQQKQQEAQGPAPSGNVYTTDFTRG